MSPILTISDVSDIKTAKNGNQYVIVQFEPYEDEEGVLNFPSVKAVFESSYFDKLTIGKKVRF